MVNGKKLLAMFLVFTLMFSHFAVVTESLATTGFVSLFGGNSDTGSENVEFDANLASGEETAKALVSDVNNQELALNLRLNVKESGYLKHGKVEIKANDNEELNFGIKEDNTIADLESVQSLENNVLELNKLENSSDELAISIPIEYKQEEYIHEAKLKGTAKVILSGTYVDNEGKENAISKEIPLTLAWKDNRTVRVEEEVSKYIQFGNSGVILQTIVKVDNSNENMNSLPTKTTELNVNVPKINGIAPSAVNVIANSTVGTNGKGVGEVEFSDENCVYNEETGMLNIKVENKKQLVDINQSEEYLKVEGEEAKQEERYYSKAGMDEYVLTYTFQNVGLSDEMQAPSHVEAKVVTFSGVEAENMENVATAEKENTYVLTGQTGSLVSYTVENETPEVSKVYAYLNKEVEYNSKTAINVSYTDIVEEMIIQDVENTYIDKSGNQTKTDDVYYKQISVSQENFKNILGEDGNIQILDASGNVLTTINKEMNVDENGNYVVGFESKISKITIKTSKPIATGNLVISSKKATAGTSMKKANYAGMEYLATTTVQKAKYTYVSDIVELESHISQTKLKDTATDFNFVLDRDNLSTVTTNANVEMRLELNNDKETSDVYGNSVFEIEMPEYVTNLNVTNASILYGEGLEISKIESFVRNGRIIIQVTINGKQIDLNSGVLTNGTNIVLNADIGVDMYTPSVEGTFKVSCNNNEATNYVADHKEVKIQYSAPSGVVAINTTANYNNVGTQLTSIKQGAKKDYIDIYTEAKKATMDVAIVNNNQNAISNLSILGRIPFKGVKDLETGDDLGTTIDTKMVTGIASHESNRGEFTVYYSANKEATKDLNNSSNGWTANPENLENIKSYLIVPKDSNYQMEAKQVLKFTYEYEIPANLNHNEEIYGTFMASYTNNTESVKLEEEAKPDLIGLTTGAGPELELTVKPNKTEVKALDELEIEATVKNVGKDIASDIVVNMPIPENTTFVSAEANREIVSVSSEENKVLANISQMAKDTSIVITTKVKVNNIEQYDENEIEAMATVMAKDLQKELTAKSDKVVIERSELAISQSLHYAYDYEGQVLQKGTKLNIFLMAENLTENDKENITVVTKLPKEITFSEAYMQGQNAEGKLEKIQNATYDENTNQVTWKIDKIPAEYSKVLELYGEIGDLTSGIKEKQILISSEIYENKENVYHAEDIEINLAKSSISVTQTSSTATYVKEGDWIDYTFTIANEGGLEATNLLLTDIIPDGVMVRKISYSVNGQETVNQMSETETAEMNLMIPANSTVDVNVSAVAQNLTGTQEKTATNTGTLTSSNGETITSNPVTHIIQSTGNSGELGADDEEDDPTNYNNSTDITKTYKISGVAWIDANKNGMRDDNEQRMSNVTAMLVDSTSGVIKSTMTTNGNGEYTFAGLQNGSYLVLFKYDTTLYTTATYRKEGIESNINSDVVTTKIEQNGKKENGAVTDVISINGASVSNIDIGLVESAQFSLGIDKAITKVTVQNAQGTVTEEFDRTKLAKYDIAAKYLAGTTVYVEYVIKVTNNGDLEGFASEIVDYLPQGMTFNSNLNPDWYTGSNGALYTKALADKELVAGQSQEVKLVLTKQMTAENTGIVSNTAEIADDFNIYGVSDRNSVPANKAQGEDDISTADIILTVKTGETLIYLSGMIISLLIGGAVAFIVYERVLKNKRKGGV